MTKRTCRALIASCAILFFAVASTQAQDFREGYVVKLSGDTLRGFIEYTTLGSHERTCRLLKEWNGESQYFKPEEIKGYGFDSGRRFVSKLLPGVSGSDKAFALLLEEGRMNLYQHNNLFYIEKDSILQLPAPKERVIESDTGDFKVRDRNFAGYMNIMMADCKVSLRGVRYESRFMTAAVEAYNKCTKSHVDVPGTLPTWSRINAQVFVGALYSNIKPNGFSGTLSSSDWSALAGAGVEFSSPRINDKLFLVVEAWYYKSFYQGYTELQNSAYTDRVDFTSRHQSLKIPLGIRFNLVREDRTFYFKGGFSVNILMNPTLTMTLEREQNGVVTTTYTSFSGEAENYTGLWAGLGYVHTIRRGFKVFAELRGDLIGGSSTTSLSFLTGIRF